MQPTVKPSVAQKYSQMDYPTFRTVTKPTYKQKTTPRNNFAAHKYNYVNRSNLQIYSYSQSQIIPKPTSNSIIFFDKSRPWQEQSEIYPFLEQKK